MLYCPEKYIKPVPKINDELIKLEGELDDNIAKITLAKFLRYNLPLAIDWVSGVKLAPYQIVALKGFFLRNYSMCVFGRGCAKCLDENSLLLVKDEGLVKLKDINIGDYVMSQKTYQKVLGKIENPKQDGFIVKLNGDYSIKGIPEHKVLTYNKKTLELTYKFIQDLDINNDMIPIKLGNNNWGDYDIFKEFNLAKQDFSEKEINLKDENDLFYLMGIILGDGCIRSENENLCSITSADKEIIQFIKKTCKKYFPNSSIKVKKNIINKIGNKKRKSKGIEIRFYNKIFIRFLKHFGFSLEKAHKKEIPEMLLKCSGQKVASFLSGLFDTDGCVDLVKSKKNRINIGLCSSSYKIVKMVQTLLLNFGISSRIHQCHKGGEYYILGQKCITQKAYSLIIGGKSNIELFNKYIGFKINRKQNAIDNFLSRYKNLKDYGSNLIPEIGIYLKNKYKDKFFRKEKGYKIHKNLSMDRIKYILENFDLLDKEDKQKLSEIINSNFIFRKIKSIKKCKTKTIDIQVDKEECYWSDGIINHNSFLAAIVCMFVPIFEPGTNIVISGATFRTARNIFSYMEKIQNSPEAVLLRQCLGIKSKRNDMWEWEINGGLVRAIPLNGEKVRGLRANLLILDEALLLSEDIIKNVLMPFLVAPSDIGARIKVREQEDDLIKKGLMKEDERRIFNNNSRMIVLSSASYTFEYLYTLYKQWTENIYENKEVEKATYFIQQVSWDAIPKDFIEKAVIEEAQSTDELHPAFKREYCAQFVDGSDSYFSAKKMNALTIKDESSPSVKLIGDNGKKYILSIDPNFSQSASADFFAMAVIELDEATEKGVLVHNYARAGVELKEHINYFYYLLKAFNIVMICIDNADGQFIQSANESSLFSKNGMKIKLIEYEGDKKNDEYTQMLRDVKKQYNREDKRICFKHVFNQESIRRINEQLQTWINGNRIYFGSRLERHSDYESIIKESNIPYPFRESDEKSKFIVDLIITQDDLMPLVKKQCSLIEVRSSPTGGQVFDLPPSLKRNNSVNRARKDNYTALLLGVEGANAYFNLMKEPAQVKSSRLWTPTMIGNSTL